MKLDFVSGHKVHQTLLLVDVQTLSLRINYFLKHVYEINVHAHLRSPLRITNSFSAGREIKRPENQ